MDTDKCINIELSLDCLTSAVVFVHSSAIWRFSSIVRHLNRNQHTGDGFIHVNSVAWTLNHGTAYQLYIYLIIFLPSSSQFLAMKSIGWFKIVYEKIILDDRCFWFVGVIDILNQIIICYNNLCTCSIELSFWDIYFFSRNDISKYTKKLLPYALTKIQRKFHFSCWWWWNGEFSAIQHKCSYVFNS